MPSSTITVYDWKRDRTYSYALRQSRYGDEGLEIRSYSAPGATSWYDLVSHQHAIRSIFHSYDSGLARRRFDLLRRQLRNSKRFQVL